TLNDKKKFYFIAPLAKDAEEIIDEDEKPSVKTRPVAAPTKSTTQKGGIITMYYNITDTGERKKMHGLTARRIWTTQKIKPSADACMMKDSMIIKTDGWYIDLPQFNCPLRYASNGTLAQGMKQLDCQDKFVARRSGKGKLGFPLIEKRTMIMGNGSAETTQMETTLETLEFSTEKLDSMLFEIPPGYTQAKSLEELEDKMDAGALMEMYGNKTKTANTTLDASQPVAAGAIRIGVLLPRGGEGLQWAEIQQHIATSLTGNGIEAIAVNSAEEAKGASCLYTVAANVVKLKAANKLGSFIKAIKNTDPNATSAYNIEAQLSLLSVSDGSVKGEKKVSGKFDGNANGVAKKALEEGSRDLVRELN
ncbi:MAG TPA: hypothetical protein VEY06_06505, partial [Flavisolibacter sp.]|nr:hypothetical protein [Flavisolibacter sp.]